MTRYTVHDKHHEVSLNPSPLNAACFAHTAEVKLIENIDKLWWRKVVFSKWRVTLPLLLLLFIYYL